MLLPRNANCHDCRTQLGRNRTKASAQRFLIPRSELLSGPIILCDYRKRSLSSGDYSPSFGVIEDYLAALCAKIYTTQALHRR